MRLLAALFSALVLFTSVGARHGTPVIRVAVIDTGLDLGDARFRDVLCRDGHKDFTGKGLRDNHGHGTHIAGIIKAHAGDASYCLVILKYYTDEATGAMNLQREVAAIREAARVGATVVNFSGGGPEFAEDEYLAIKAASKTTFIVAAGNEGRTLDTPGDEYYPASYPLPNVKAVGSLGKNGARMFGSDWGKRVTYWELGEDVLSTLPGGKTGHMSGTSMATAVATGKFLAGQLEPKASRCSPDTGGCSLRNIHRP